MNPSLSMEQMLLMAVIGLASAFVGGGVWTFASAWLTGRFNKEEKEVERLRADHRRCEEKVEALQKRLEEALDRLEAVEHHHASLVPRWIRDANKRIRWINGAAMVTIFGPLRLARDKVEGHTFDELLDQNASRQIDLMDHAALARPGLAVSTVLQLHPSLPKMHIIKVAGVGRDGELIFEGYAYCMNDPDEVASRGERRQEEQLGISLLRTGQAAPPAGDGSPRA